MSPQLDHVTNNYGFIYHSLSSPTNKLDGIGNQYDDVITMRLFNEITSDLSSV